MIEKELVDFSSGERNFLKENAFSPEQWLLFEVVDDHKGKMNVQVISNPL